MNPPVANGESIERECRDEEDRRQGGVAPEEEHRGEDERGELGEDGLEGGIGPCGGEVGEHDHEPQAYGEDHTEAAQVLDRSDETLERAERCTGVVDSLRHHFGCRQSEHTDISVIDGGDDHRPDGEHCGRERERPEPKPSTGPAQAVSENHDRQQRPQRVPRAERPNQRDCRGRGYEREGGVDDGAHVGNRQTVVPCTASRRTHRYAAVGVLVPRAASRQA